LSFDGAPGAPPPPPEGGWRADRRLVATVVGGIFALAAAGVTAYATFASVSASDHSDTRDDGAASTSSAPRTITSAPVGATASPSPSPALRWSFLVDEDMKGGGIDMDAWPEFSYGTIDVGPERAAGGELVTDFLASNGARITDEGANQPTPAQCVDDLRTAGNDKAVVSDGGYYCVRTSEQKLLLIQVKSINDDGVSLRGYKVADATTL